MFWLRTWDASMHLISSVSSAVRGLPGGGQGSWVNEIKGSKQNSSHCQIIVILDKLHSCCAACPEQPAVWQWGSGSCDCERRVCMLT